MINIKILTLDIRENTIKMLIIQKFFGKVKFLNRKVFEFNQIDKNGLMLDINKLSKMIKNELNNLKIPCQKISFAVQNETIINRNIKIINTSYKNDIKGLIEYELNEYMPIDINEYILKYNVLNQELDYLDIQAILMPKTLMNSYIELSKKLKIKSKSLSINFDILNNLIYNKFIQIEEGNNLILDIGNQYTNINLIENKVITNSYTLNNIDIYDFLDSEIKGKYNKIYYYGLENSELLMKLNSKFNIQKLLLKNIQKHELNNFINNIGLI